MVAFLPRLRRFAYVLTGDVDKGDDLVQETCVHALSRLDQLQPGTSLNSWMFRIAQTRWLDRMRAQKVRGEFQDLDEARNIPGEDGRTTTESRLTLARVSEGISRLSPEQQILIGLIVVEGHSYKDVAEILDIPIGTVMSRLARARLSLFEFAEGSDAQASARKPESDRGQSD
jgi:RNA polymerase sigma-70 factor, ECF subfamily